jgi:hypothetical protein
MTRAAGTQGLNNEHVPQPSLLQGLKGLAATKLGMKNSLAGYTMSAKFVTTQYNSQFHNRRFFLYCLGK